MSTNKVTKYKKIYKTGFLIGYKMLFSGGDHLLYIDNPGGYRESYKRFFFDDIQAIKVRYHYNIKALIVGLIILIQIVVFAIFHNDFYYSFQQFYAVSFGCSVAIELWYLMTGSPVTATLKTFYGSEQLFLGSRYYAQRRLQKIIEQLTVSANPPLSSYELKELAESDRQITI